MSAPVTPDTLTDEMIEVEMVRAGNNGDHDYLEQCRRAAEGCASKVMFDYAVATVCDAINARAGKESK